MTDTHACSSDVTRQSIRCDYTKFEWEISFISFFSLLTSFWSSQFYARLDLGCGTGNAVEGPGVEVPADSFEPFLLPMAEPVDRLYVLSAFEVEGSSISNWRSSSLTY